MGHKMRYRKCFTKTLAALLSTVLLFSTIGFSTMAEASGTEDIPGGSYVEEQNVNASFEENGPEQNSDPANTSNPTGTPDGGNSDSSGTPDGGPTETPGGGNSNPSGTLEGGNFVGDPKPGRTHDDSDNTPQRNANTVAVIGNEQFSSLEEAIDAVKEHQEGATTIQILKDTIIAKQINIERKKIILTADEARTITFSIATTDTNCFRVGNWSDTAASLTISGPLTITTTNESLRSIVNVTKKSFFSLRGGTLSSGTADLSHAIVCVDNGGNMEMSGGVIQGSQAHSSRGVMLQSTDTQKMSFTMTDGMIQDCFVDKNHHYGNGAGIFVGGTAQFTMSGESTISNCTAEKFGGGVYVHTKTDRTGTPAFYMQDGTISYCTAGGGGGIYTEKDNIFTMSGGTVTENKAHGGGAGIFLRTTKAEISGGSITNNTSECEASFGGGIYVEKEATLQLYNTVIKENTAAVLGGGLWTCSTGDIKIYITDGGAVYDNRAQDATGTQSSNQAGDDISNFIGSGHLTLYAHMLGGGLNQYYKDGGVTWYFGGKPACGADRGPGTGAADPNAKRYGDDFQELYTDTVDKSTYITLKNVVSEDAKTAAMNNAKLIISGNHASRGAGIGTNGNLIIGRPSDKTYSVTVEKKWENTSKEDQVGVGVYLVIGDKKLGPVKLNKENNWTATFTGLTDDPRETEYSVQEILVDGFTTQIDRVVDGNKISFTITNTYWPDEPDKPDGPDEPGKPDVPDEPEFPDTSNPTDDVPNTGDETNLALWLMLMCFSGLAMISTPVLCRPHYKGKHCKSESKR